MSHQTKLIGTFGTTDGTCTCDMVTVLYTKDETAETISFAFDNACQITLSFPHKGRKKDTWRKRPQPPDFIQRKTAPFF